MNDKRFKQYEEKFNMFSNEIDSIKNEINFETLLIEYVKNKKALKEFNSKFKNETYNKDLSLKLKDSELLKKQHLEEFKKVESVEKKLYQLKKEIHKLIVSLDKDNNFHDYRKLILENKNKLNSKTIDKKHLSFLEQKIKKNNSKIIDCDNKILELKNLKKPFSYLKYKKNQYKIENNKIQKEIKINKQKNEKDVNKIIEKNIITINELSNKSIKIKENIDILLGLVNKINEKLSFKDNDEYNNEHSFIIENLNVWYGPKQALFDINVAFPKNEVISIIGPSGCGKTTFLRTLNRINDNVESYEAKGKIILNGEYDIFKLKSIKNKYDKLDLSTLRTKVGMIFQQPNPFPMSIYKNVSYGPSIKGIKNKAFLNNLVASFLKDAWLYDEVKDNLKVLGTTLSGGQQQRLCIARAIANEPEILLMDEPTSALDPISAKKIEDLIVKLKENYTIIMVTHSMQQAQRISDKIAFFYQGKLIEYGNTKQIFNNPKQKETKEYIKGKFG